MELQEYEVAAVNEQTNRQGQPVYNVVLADLFGGGAIQAAVMPPLSLSFNPQHFKPGTRIQAGIYLQKGQPIISSFKKVMPEVDTKPPKVNVPPKKVREKEVKQAQKKLESLFPEVGFERPPGGRK